MAVRQCKKLLRLFANEHDGRHALMSRVMWQYCDSEPTEPTPDSDIELTFTLLTPIKELFPNFSDHDFYQLCGIVACGELEIPFVSGRSARDFFFVLLDILSTLEQEKGKAGQTVVKLKKKLLECKDNELKSESVTRKLEHQSRLVASIGPEINAAVQCLVLSPKFYAARKNHIRMLHTYMRAAVIEAGSIIRIHAANPLERTPIFDMALREGYKPRIED